MSWSERDLNKLKSSGKIRDFKVTERKVAQNANKITKSANKLPQNAIKVPKAIREIKKALHYAAVLFETEYYFAKPRMFRFDIAILEHKIAIEYEGIVSAKSRHTSIKGFTRDTTKYNLAQQLGWRVLRYTALNYKEFKSDLKAIINGIC